jgi:hypothetical protein
MHAPIKSVVAWKNTKKGGRRRKKARKQNTQ